MIDLMITLVGDWEWLAPKTWEHKVRLWFLLLVPILIALYLLANRIRKKLSMRYTNTSILGRVVPNQRRWLRHVAVAMSLSSLITLIIASAIPKAADRVPQERATIVVVIDVSLSMQATDVKPDRIQAAKDAASEFVSNIKDGYNISVVSLSGNPGVRLPPTSDKGAARRAIEALELQESTAIGDAIVAALTAVSQAPKSDDGSVPPASIVLLSDGTNTAGRSPIQAAEQAAKAKIPIYTVAFGTQSGYVDLDNKREPVPPDSELMSAIAQKTGGETISATSLEDLRKAYERLQSRVGYKVVMTEVTAKWAGFGLLFGILAAIAAIMMAARWP